MTESLHPDQIQTLQSVVAEDYEWCKSTPCYVGLNEIRMDARKRGCQITLEQTRNAVENIVGVKIPASVERAQEGGRHFCRNPVFGLKRKADGGPMSEESDDEKDGKDGNKNLYCVQWLNLELGEDGAVQARAMPFYKIGKGKLGRERNVHGQNPARFGIVQMWQGAALMERYVHDVLKEHRIELGGGQEWFHIPQNNVTEAVEDAIVRALVARRQIEHADTPPLT